MALTWPVVALGPGAGSRRSVVLLRDGDPAAAALALEHMPLAKVQEAARQQGVAHLTVVKLAILEPSPRVSVIRR